MKLLPSHSLSVEVRVIDWWSVARNEGNSAGLRSGEIPMKEKVSIFIGEKKSNTISVPLYATSPGEYVIEPIVLKKGNKYLISNSSTIKIKE